VADDLSAFARKLDRIEKDLAGKSGGEARMGRYGLLGKRAAVDALASDIGDASMSNWRRSKPIDLKPAYEVLSNHEVEIAPRPRQRGPWRVLESGRQARGKGDAVRTKRRRKDGTFGTRKAKRAVGASPGKNTWTDARKLIEKRFFRAVHEDTTKVLRKHFGF
jgi:hypothetical protein